MNLMTWQPPAFAGITGARRNNIRCRRHSSSVRCYCQPSTAGRAGWRAGRPGWPHASPRMAASAFHIICWRKPPPGRAGRRPLTAGQARRANAIELPVLSWLADHPRRHTSVITIILPAGHHDDAMIWRWERRIHIPQQQSPSQYRSRPRQAGKARLLSFPLPVQSSDARHLQAFIHIIT